MQIPLEPWIILEELENGNFIVLELGYDDADGEHVSDMYDFDFLSYANLAVNTAVFPDEKAYEYLALGLVGEAGEVAGKIKKYLRGDYLLTEEKINEIGDELGDVLWYVAVMCKYLNLDYEKIHINNLTKLYDRKNRDVIKGDGDVR